MQISTATITHNRLRRMRSLAIVLHLRRILMGARFTSCSSKFFFLSITQLSGSDEPAPDPPDAPDAALPVSVLALLWVLEVPVLAAGSLLDASGPIRMILSRLR